MECLDNPVVAALDTFNNALGIELPRLVGDMEQRLKVLYMRNTMFQERDPQMDLGFKNFKRLDVALRGMSRRVLIHIERVDTEDLESPLCQDEHDTAAWGQKLAILRKPGGNSILHQAAVERANKLQQALAHHRPEIWENVVRNVIGMLQRQLFDSGDVSCEDRGFLFLPWPEQLALPKCIRLVLDHPDGLFFDEWLRVCSERLNLGAQPLHVAIWDMYRLCPTFGFEDALHEVCTSIPIDYDTGLPANEDGFDVARACLKEFSTEYRGMWDWLRTLPSSMVPANHFVFQNAIV